MMAAKENDSNEARAARRRQTLLLSVVMLVGLGSAAALNRWQEVRRPPVDPALEEENLYVTGGAARRMSLSFNGLIADWYWMRSLQYVGRKVIKQGDKFSFNDLGGLDLRLLYPLLDTATTLDPQFIPVYEYGAVVLPSINDEHAIKLLEKGIESNPAEWRLYHHLGYIYWQRDDYQTAAAKYAAGAEQPNAPAWMRAMSARMLAEGGSRATAREIYQRMYDEADDETIKRMAELRLAQITSFEERDRIRKVLKEYQARQGRCASDWREVANALRAAGLKVDRNTGAPLDPADTPYLLFKDQCDVDLDPKSIVPYK
jgi:tetratricopeptide (TPR) repeat protein